MKVIGTVECPNCKSSIPFYAEDQGQHLADHHADGKCRDSYYLRTKTMAEGIAQPVTVKRVSR